MASTISSKGWVIIPAELRKKYHLVPGTKVVIVDNGGLLKGGTSLTKALLNEHATESKRDEARIKRFTHG